MNILIVDDHAMNRDLLSFILTDEGHHCSGAENGLIALDLVKEGNQIDLILMDVNMPIMDGIIASENIKEHIGDKHLPIIFVTALDNAETITRCLEAGGDDFVPKPINEEVLIAKINAHARTHSLYLAIAEANTQLKYHKQLMDREHAIVEHVFESSISNSKTVCSNINAYTSPVSMFNGDLLLQAPSPSGGVHILVGDFTGHGLSAAIGSLPVTEMFYNRVAQHWGVPAIAAEINARLFELLPGNMFFCCTLLSLAHTGSDLVIWSGGMNDLILARGDSEVKKVSAMHMPMGVLSPEEFDDEVMHFQVDDSARLYVYTDGVTEAENADGEQFGFQRLVDTIAASDNNTVNFIKDAVKEYQGNVEQNDDVSLVEIKGGAVLHVDKNTGERVDVGSEYHNAESFPWYIYMYFGDKDLRKHSISDQLMGFISNIEGIELHKENFFIIVSELYSNALEHGVLRLQSSMKNDPDGFEEYYKLRQKRLDKLDNEYIELSVEYIRGNPNILKIVMTDSGDGFDYTALDFSIPKQETVAQDDQSVQEEQGYGRGISLLNSLCSSMEFSNNGSTVTVEYPLCESKMD